MPRDKMSKTTRGTKIRLRCDGCGEGDTVISRTPGQPELPEGWVLVGKKRYCPACRQRRGGM
jgi:ribosomal protein L44E